MKLDFKVTRYMIKKYPYIMAEWYEYNIFSYFSMILKSITM